MNKPTGRIVNALLWGALIMALSALFADHEDASMLILLTVPAWLVADSLFSGATQREWRCIQRRFRRGG